MRYDDYANKLFDAKCIEEFEEYLFYEKSINDMPSFPVPSDLENQHYTEMRIDHL